MLLRKFLLVWNFWRGNFWRSGIFGGFWDFCFVIAEIFVGLEFLARKFLAVGNFWGFLGFLAVRDFWGFCRFGGFEGVGVDVGTSMLER